ncbi:MAG: cysteine dioxygenase family protein [Vicingaceae bacterium]
MPIADIETVTQLKKNLNLGPGYGGYVELFNALKIPMKEWAPYCTDNADHYTRNCVSSCDGYEFILMCWQKGQQSAIHSFDFQEGWIKVIEGELTIETYDVDRDAKSCELKETITVQEGESTYLNDSMGFHKVVNSASGPTKSLHLHVERVDLWEIFDPEEKSFKSIQPRYDSLDDDCQDYPEK